MSQFKITHTNGNVREFEAGEVHDLTVTESRRYIEVTTDVGTWLAKSVEAVGVDR